jgi:hypothetical protein
VLEADREARRAAGEATGEVETWDERKLAGKRMGDRVAGRTRAPEVEDRLKKAKEKCVRACVDKERAIGKIDRFGF